MSDGIVQRIACVDPLPGYRLCVTWRNGTRAIVDFRPDLHRGGIWAALRDEVKFRAAWVTHHGAVLEWPDPAGPDGAPRIDVDAYGLWQKTLEQARGPALAEASGTIFGGPEAPP